MSRMVWSVDLVSWCAARHCAMPARWAQIGSRAVPHHDSGRQCGSEAIDYLNSRLRGSVPEHRTPIILRNPETRIMAKLKHATGHVAKTGAE